MKKVLILAGVLMFLGAASPTLAQEQEITESNLTPRQQLLLQVPEKIKKESEWNGWKVAWEALHDTAWGPSDFVTLKKEDQLWIITAVGANPKMLSVAIPRTDGGNDFFPGFVAYFRNNTLEVFLSFIEFNEDELKRIAEMATKRLVGALKALGLATDAELANYVKGGLKNAHE